MPAIIRYCTCKEGPGANFQDRKYGRRRRVHNLTQDGRGGTCTVCGDKKKF